MARILIPSDDKDFVIHLARTYSREGHEVVVGALNFFTKHATFDLVHFLWPEEFSAWRPPDTKMLEEIRYSLEWWSTSARTLISVNNLFPHGMEGNQAYKDLYSLFYKTCAVIVHHSEASRKLVWQHFSAARGKPNVIATMFNYNDLVKADVDRASLRREFRIAEKDFVILVFGSLRLWAEVRLLIGALTRARVKNKRLLVVARYNEISPMPGWRIRVLRFIWRLWLRIMHAIVVTNHVPNEDVYKYFEVADAVVVPRLNDLSSAVVAISFSFGKLVIAPNHGAFPDYLDGTRNLLYESGIPRSLASKIELATQLPRAAIGEHNRQVARKWTWEGIVSACTKAVSLHTCV